MGSGNSRDGLDLRAAAAWRLGCCVLGLALLSAVRVCASERGDPGATQGPCPPVISVLTPNTCSGDTSKPEPRLLPLGVFAEGRWQRAGLDGLIPTSVNGTPQPLSAMQQQELAALLGETFYALYGALLTLTPSSTAVCRLINSRYFCLAGSLSDTGAAGCATGPVVMLNRQATATPPYPIEKPEEDPGLTAILMAAMVVPAEELRKEQDTPVESFADRIEKLELREAVTEVLGRILSEEFSEEVYSGRLKAFLQENGVQMSETDELLLGAIGGGETQHEPGGQNEEQRQKTRALVTLIAQFGTAADERKPRDPKLDLGLFGQPKVDEALAFELGSSKKGLWVHALRPYPVEHAPKDEFFPGFPMWSVEYFGLLEALPSRAYRMLWEETRLLGSPWERLKRSLLGACDANGDGWAEVIFTESAHEYRAYTLYSHVDGRYVNSCSASGSL